MTFGAWLQEKRRLQGLSLRQTGQIANVSHTYVATLEQARPHPSTGALPRPNRDVVVKLAEALRASIPEALAAAGYSSDGAYETLYLGSDGEADAASGAQPAPGNVTPPLTDAKHASPSHRPAALSEGWGSPDASEEPDRSRSLAEASVPDVACGGDAGRTQFPCLPPQTASSQPGPAFSAHDNLPCNVTTFVGRDAELKEVRYKLSTCRLLTLTGVGGCGKTRLAQNAAAHAKKDFRDGVCFVDLTPIDKAKARQIPSAILSALGRRAERNAPQNSPQNTLVEYLKHRRLLLILDNCEHLVRNEDYHGDDRQDHAPDNFQQDVHEKDVHDVGSYAFSLLTACRDIKILATSRRPLSVVGETTLRVRALSQPPDDLDSNDEDFVRRLEGYAAVRLFVDRARSAQSDFALDRQSGAAVKEICRRLDGIPLAIEMAAAKVRVLSVAQIAQRLALNVDFLTGDSTESARHQTLLKSFDWSYSLLHPDEQTLLRRISVLAGNWSLRASESICAFDPLNSEQILDLLTRLVDASFLVFEVQNGAGRYRMLDTVREYAQMQLSKAEESERLHERHAHHFLALAAESVSGLAGPGQAEWLERLGQEYDNLRASLQWFKENDPESALKLATSLAWFLDLRAHWREAYQWLKELLTDARPVSPHLQAKAHIAAGNMAWAYGDIEAAREDFEHARSLCRTALKKQPDGGVSGSEAQTASDFGPEEAMRLLARTLNNIAALETETGNFAQARRLHFHSLAIKRKLNVPGSEATSLINIGYCFYLQGNYSAARRYLENGLAMLGDNGEPRIRANALNNLGGALRALGDFGQARRRLKEALRIRQDLGDRRHLAYSLEEFSLLAVAERELEKAVTLLGAEDSLRNAANQTRGPAEKERWARLLGDLQARLKPPDFAAALKIGRSMSPDQAARFAVFDSPADDEGRAG